MDTRDTLIAWLNDAHAMENALVSTLERQADRAQDRPEIRERLLQHADETRGHARRVEQCIEDLGGSTSTVKDAMGKVEGWMAGLTNAVAGDDIVKDALSGYAAEHLEIASYQALIAGAEALGEQQVVDACEEILEDEERQANWLETNLPAVVQNYLGQEVGGRRG